VLKVGLAFKTEQVQQGGLAKMVNLIDLETAKLKRLTTANLLAKLDEYEKAYWYEEAAEAGYNYAASRMYRDKMESIKAILKERGAIS
jgi:hypothetical protein